MKANELRIGNYVNWINTQEPYSLFLIEEIKELNYFDCFEPIPLTLEWFLKFDFQWSYGGYIRKTSRGLIFIEEDLAEISYNTKEKGFQAPCKHVHQLQNLYFTLTGEELKIKP